MKCVKNNLNKWDGCKNRLRIQENFESEESGFLEQSMISSSDLNSQFVTFVIVFLVLFTVNAWIMWVRRLHLQSFPQKLIALTIIAYNIIFYTSICCSQKSQDVSSHFLASLMAELSSLWRSLLIITLRAVAVLLQNMNIHRHSCAYISAGEPLLCLDFWKLCYFQAQLNL